MSSLQAHFLVASPYLTDPNFNRSVVLLIRHNEEGAFGVLLNRPMNNTVREIMRLAGEGECECDQPIYYGGPVQGPLVAVHGLEEHAEAEILPGVYFSAHKDQLRSIVDQDELPFRLFSGYSGWGDGQLEGELEVGGWLTAEATAELVFLSSEQQWQRLTREIGLDILGPEFKSKQLPDDPSLN
jgi:putative transcriptional regulator